MNRSEYTSIAATQTPDTPLERTLKPDRVPLLFPDLPLDSAIPYLARWPVLPIQNRASRGTLEGIVSLDDVLGRYHSNSMGNNRIQMLWVPSAFREMRE